MWGMSFGDGGPTSPYMALYNASHHAIKAVSPRLSIGGPATMELLDVTTFISSAVFVETMAFQSQKIFYELTKTLTNA